MTPTGETKSDREPSLEEKFSEFGRQRQKKLVQKLQKLKLEKEQKDAAINAHKKLMKKHKKQLVDSSSDSDDDNDDEYWVDKTTCETNEQKCVLWHLICSVIGICISYGAIELALAGLPSPRNGGELIPILMGVIGVIIALDSLNRLYKDVEKGLCPCQETIKRKGEFSNLRRQEDDLGASISLAHARADQLNRQAKELPTVQMVKENMNNGGKMSKKPSKQLEPPKQLGGEKKEYLDIEKGRGNDYDKEDDEEVNASYSDGSYY
jgi:hypothetical protein